MIFKGLLVEEDIVGEFAYIVLILVSVLSLERFDYYRFGSFCVWDRSRGCFSLRF